MPEINKWVIPKNIEKPVETVYELESKELMMPEEKFQIINSFEERRNLISNKSKLSSAARNKIIKRHGTDYLSERAFNHDVALMQMYGPGFWDEIGSPVTKFLVSAGASALIVGTGGAAAPIVLTGAALAGGGKIAKEIGKKTDCEALE